MCKIIDKQKSVLKISDNSCSNRTIKRWLFLELKRYMHLVLLILQNDDLKKLKSDLEVE